MPWWLIMTITLGYIGMGLAAGAVAAVIADPSSADWTGNIVASILLWPFAIVFMGIFKYVKVMKKISERHHPRGIIIR